MPKIGLRNLKTAIAVAFTLIVHFILYVISPSFAATWYSPFFAGIAAVYSMQRDNSKSFSQAKIRSFGSLFGGLFGMVIILIYENLFMDAILDQLGYIGHLAILYTITALLVIPLIAFLVQFKKQDLVFVAALTYLSVTISLRNNLPVAPFAINRISSTIIGVLITLGVNQFHWHRYKHKDILFVSGLDQCLLTKHRNLSSFTSYTLTNLINDGMHFTVSTTRTPASLNRIFKDIPLNLELMIMNGAVIYDLKKEKYLDIKYLSKEAQMQIDQYFIDLNRNVFAYSIVDQALSMYHTSFANPAEEKFYLDRKNDDFRNHIKGRLSSDENAVFYIVIDRKEQVETYAKDLTTLIPFDISYQIYPYMDDYFYLKIHRSETSKENALSSFLMKHQDKYVIAFGSMSFDVNIMKQSNYSVALSTADFKVKQIADYVIDSNQPDDLIKLMKKIYYAKDPISYLHQLKTEKK